MKKLSLLFATILLFTVVFSNIIGKAADEEDQTVYYKYYTSIRIEQGDTLWDIAKSHDPEGRCDIEDYVKELVLINGLESEEIHAGQNLTVFYYDTRVK